jgi:DNA-binding beta-propeller fold protein YncE
MRRELLAVAVFALMLLEVGARAEPFAYVAVSNLPNRGSVVKLDTGVDPPLPIVATFVNGPEDITPFGVALDPTNSYVYVTYLRSGTFGVYDANCMGTCSQLANITLSDGKGTIPTWLGPKEILVTADGKQAYVTLNGICPASACNCPGFPESCNPGPADVENQDNVVAILDLTASPPEQVGTIAVDWGPFAMANAGSFYYLTNFCGSDGPATSVAACSTHPGTAMAIDPLTNAVAWTYTNSANQGFHWAAVVLGDPDNQIFYHGANYSNTFLRVAADGSEATVHALPGSPRGLALRPDGTLVYIADYTHNTVYPYAVATGTLGEGISLGPGPGAVAVVWSRSGPNNYRALVGGFDTMNVTPVTNGEVGAPTPLIGKAVGGAATCTPSNDSCVAQGLVCGRATDGCTFGGTVSCGCCPPGQSCYGTYCQ